MQDLSHRTEPTAAEQSHICYDPHIQITTCTNKPVTHKQQLTIYCLYRILAILHPYHDVWHVLNFTLLKLKFYVLVKAPCECATGIIERGCGRENENAQGKAECVIISRDCNRVQ